MPLRQRPEKPEMRSNFHGRSQDPLPLHLPQPEDEDKEGIVVGAVNMEPGTLVPKPVFMGLLKSLLADRGGEKTGGGGGVVAW